MCQINLTDYVATRVGESRELYEKGSDKVASILLFFVSKIEVEINYGCLSGVTNCDYMLYDRGTTSM